MIVLISVGSVFFLSGCNKNDSIEDNQIEQIPSACNSSIGFNIGKLATGQKIKYDLYDDGDLQRGLVSSYIRDNEKKLCVIKLHI